MIYLKYTVIHRTTHDGQVQQRVVNTNYLSKVRVIHRTTRDDQVQQRVVKSNELSKMHSNTQNNT